MAGGWDFFFGVWWVGMGDGVFDGWRMFGGRKRRKVSVAWKGSGFASSFRMEYSDGEIARARCSFRF